MTNIYTELYALSDPPVSWDYLIESAELNERGEKIIPYNLHEIDQEIYNEVVNKHLKESKLRKYEKESISRSILLGCSPKFKKPQQ